MGYVDQILHIYLFWYCPATGMQNGGEGLPRIILVSRGLLVKMLITQKLWYAKRWLGFVTKIILVKAHHRFAYSYLDNVKMY